MDDNTPQVPVENPQNDDFTPGQAGQETTNPVRQAEAEKEKSRRIKIQYEENDEDEFDLDNEEDLERFRKQAIHGKKANKKYQEADDKQKAFESAVLTAAQEGNQSKILEAFGIDPYEFAQKLLASKYDDENMTDEEKQARQDREDAERYRSEREELEKKEAEEQRKAQMNQKVQNLNNDLREAAEGLPNFPDDPELQLECFQDALKALYNARQFAISRGLEVNLTMKQALNKAVKAQELRTEKYLQKLGPKAYDFISKNPDMLKSIREADLARHKAAKAPSPQSTAGTGRQSTPPNVDRSKMSEREWAEWNRNRFLGK